MIKVMPIIDHILEEGNKLRSLKELKEYYKLSFPFTAYKVNGAVKGEHTILSIVRTGEEMPIRCVNCKSRIKAIDIGAVSNNIHCNDCKIRLNLSNSGFFDINIKRWRLI